MIESGSQRHKQILVYYNYGYAGFKQHNNVLLQNVSATWQATKSILHAIIQRWTKISFCYRQCDQIKIAKCL